MILAPQQRAATFSLRADRVRPVSTDIVKSPKSVVFAEDYDEAEGRECEGLVVARFAEERGVADVEPGFAEDGAGFQGVEGRGGVPVGWKVEFFCDEGWGRWWCGRFGRGEGLLFEGLQLAWYGS